MVTQMPRTVVITQKELLQYPEEREARRLLAERLKQLRIKEQEALIDLEQGGPTKRIKKFFEEPEKQRRQPQTENV